MITRMLSIWANRMLEDSLNSTALKFVWCLKKPFTKLTKFACIVSVITYLVDFRLSTWVSIISMSLARKAIVILEQRQPKL